MCHNEYNDWFLFEESGIKFALDERKTGYPYAQCS